MSENLYKLWVSSFSTNLALKLQQMGSMLRGRVREETFTGAKQASPVDQVGAIAVRTAAGRFAPMPRVDADFTRRWIFPSDKELPQLIDTFDKLKTIQDPQSIWVTNAAMAFGRAWDDAIIAAATGTAYTGNGADGTALTSETFDTTNHRVADTFGSSAASGLTVSKLIEARRIMRHYHVDFDNDPLTLVIGSQQESDLLNQVEYVSTEFNDRPVLVDGRVKRFLGFDIVVTERLPTYTTTTRGVLAFVKSGLVLGTWQDMTHNLDIRSDLSGRPFQLYSTASFGASRIEPGRVIQIACKDAVGADITT